MSTMRLLRVDSGGECPDIRNNGWHQNSCVIERQSGVARDDPRWPSHCTCGHKFDDAAARQIIEE